MRTPQEIRQVLLEEITAAQPKTPLDGTLQQNTVLTRANQRLNIINDLVTPVVAPVNGSPRARVFDGGLLGQWAVWTHRAVELLARAKTARATDLVPSALLRDGAALTDANAAIFDVANGFAGCIAGIHEVLRRQGLLAGTWCLDPGEQLSPKQRVAIDRVLAAYPALTDDDFVAAHLDEWLR